jgi:hypothetical protein
MIREGVVKHSLGAAIVAAAIILAAGLALAADLPLRAAAPAYVAQEQPSKQIRASIVVTGASLAAAASANARDDHVLEFLRWKQQRSAANNPAVEASKRVISR